MIFEEEAYLEHYGVKGMRWGQRKSRPLETRSNRYQKRVGRQQKQIDRMKRVAAGTASRGEKFVVAGFQTTIPNLVLGKGVQGGTQRMIGQMKKEQELINAGKLKTWDMLKRSSGINVRYLNYS